MKGDAMVKASAKKYLKDLFYEVKDIKNNLQLISFCKTHWMEISQFQSIYSLAIPYFSY
jgi:hypothetical protein